MHRNPLWPLRLSAAERFNLSPGQRWQMCLAKRVAALARQYPDLPPRELVRVAKRVLQLKALARRTARAGAPTPLPTH